MHNCLLSRSTRTKKVDVLIFFLYTIQHTCTCNCKISVAERVYRLHRKKPILLNGIALDIELESPALLDHHHHQSLRISGLNPDLDPEKLKFYIAAVSGRTVTEILFDESHAKAIAQFRSQIGT